jgi:hypothetical protein
MEGEGGSHMADVSVLTFDATSRNPYRPRPYTNAQIRLGQYVTVKSSERVVPRGDEIPMRQMSICSCVCAFIVQSVDALNPSQFHTHTHTHAHHFLTLSSCILIRMNAKTNANASTMNEWEGQRLRPTPISNQQPHSARSCDASPDYTGHRRVAAHLTGAVG